MTTLYESEQFAQEIFLQELNDDLIKAAAAKVIFDEMFGED